MGPRPESALIVTADDYGYARGYDAGILAAATAGAVDAVSVMVGEGRDPDSAALLTSGVEVGLHLELDARTRAAALAELARQLGEFQRLFGRLPAHVDGHRHCHAAPGLDAAIGRACADRGLPLRSVGARHRRTLRRLGVLTQDRLVGRLGEQEPVVPPEIATWVEADVRPPGLTEWMVHPGHPDSSSGSSYDAGRADDLELVLRLAREPALARARTTHAAAFRTASASLNRH